jgi:hypothetical protein
MKITISILALATHKAASQDVFNYDTTSGNSYGPEDWGKVKCDNLATCVRVIFAID